ncbi:MAG: DNA double-strand break repair nuclease NurA [Candidatus Lokiarchaeota archaeon]|nr:DNA double-strand break repair nuclease NurA [Candidatus Lokiarchaeota archaeon]
MLNGKDFLINQKRSYQNTEIDINSKVIGTTKEKLLMEQLENIAFECNEIESLKKRFANLVIKNGKKLDFGEFLEHPKFFIKENLIKKSINPSNIRGLNIVSVDGSFVVKKFMNIDFSFLKAIAVKYYFYDNKDAKIDYFPDLNGFNNYSIKRNVLNVNEQYIDVDTSLDMNFMEIQLINNLIKKSNDLDFIIIDGSIVIMPINLLFSKDPVISEKYDNLLKEYQKLYKNCNKNGILLIGSIKDTRTSALCNLLRDSVQLLKPNYNNLHEFLEIGYRQVIRYFSDLDLFNRILYKNERSCIFNCKREIDKIRDTGIKKEISYYFPLTFYAYYLKTTKYDIPCRIEFFMDEKHDLEEAAKKADLIASIILPISSLNDHYGLPIPQIEAHKRAVFKPYEVNLLFNSLKRKLNKYGVNLIEKRRNRRPF